MAMAFAQPNNKNILPYLFCVFCISVIILFFLVSETTYSDAGRRTLFRRNYSDAPPFTFLIKVLTFNRLHSLSRCLRSLAAADYGVAGDRGRIHLHVYVDHFNLGQNQAPPEDNLKTVREILVFLDQFDWRFGEKLVHYRTNNAGLQAQWLEAWWPTSDHEFAFVVEDDLEVSPLYYEFLERLIQKYYYDTSNFNPSIFGASLQRPRLVPGKRGNDIRVDPKTNLLLYQLVGTWGQLLFPKPWKEFRLWYDEHKAKGKKPFLNGMVSNGWYKKMGERIWTPWFIKFVYSRAYFNIYTNFPNEGALSVSHRDAGVNYAETAGPDSQLLNRSSISSDFLNKFQPLSNLKWYDFCFSEVVPGRVVKNLNELGTILPSLQREKTIILVSLYDADKMSIRNLLCHFQKLNTQNHIFIGPSSELSYDLSRRGHPVIDVDVFLDKLITSKTSYPNSAKEALGNAYVVKKCLELGYSTWVFSSNAVLVDKAPLLATFNSEYDFYIEESSGILIVQSSSVTQNLWNNELVHSIASSATKNPSPKKSLNFIHLVKKLVEQKGKRIKTVETMGIAENTAISVNQSLGDGKPVVYWSREVGSNIIQTKLEELNLWLIDDDHSCKAVICHRSQR